MEKYNEIWKEICFQINKNKNTSEREFQIIAESIFEKLGWKQYLNEIARPTIPFGAANYGIPDIVIQSNNIKHYVVELKKISMGISERNVAQLISYMRQMQLSFGVLIGNSISIYYDDNSTSKSIKVVEVQFDSDNKLGPVILQHLSKDGFSKEKFKEFCINQIEKQSAIKEQEKQIEFLCSEEGSKYIKDLLSTEYSEEVLNSIEITITNNTRKLEISNLNQVRKQNSSSKSIDPNFSFETWLNPRYKASTVVNYHRWVRVVLEREGLIWDELTNKIGFIVMKYGIGGSEYEFGLKGKASVINALRRYQDFVRSQ